MRDETTQYRVSWGHQAYYSYGLESVLAIIDDYSPNIEKVGLQSRHENMSQVPWEEIPKSHIMVSFLRQLWEDFR